MRRYTPESYHERLQETWFKNLPDEADWGLMPHRTDEERRERYISDAEYAALTMLRHALEPSNASILHPILRVMVRRYLTDPTYVGWVPDPDTITDNEWRKAYGVHSDDDPSPRVDSSRKQGFWAVQRSHHLFELAYPSTDDDDYDTELYKEYRQNIDRAAVRLLHAIDTHRCKGEEGIETMVGLGFGGGIITSLAAAAAEYHAHTLRLTVNYHMSVSK